ncbi:NUDIX hydrolase [Candidatus Saccharibacteria bacterium]|nr:NUDIX hydrolase [Candidatus Saccharibacteria bacterium]
MSHEISVHTAQTAILRELLFHPSAGFAQLQKPTGLDSDHFKFHINRLVEVGYVTKKEDGTYTLSTAGKEYANRLDTDINTIEKQPKLSVALIIENEDGKFLSQQRLKQPYYGFWGRATGKVGWGETLLETGARELMEEAGLTADLSVGGFYHKMDYEKGTEKMLEDKLFCVIYGTNPQGELIVDAEGHHNEWLSNEELAKKGTVFESVPEITEMCQKPGIGYIEHKYYYNPEEY